jgi:hypothetical protein
MVVPLMVVVPVAEEEHCLELARLILASSATKSMPLSAETLPTCDSRV